MSYRSLGLGDRLPVASPRVQGDFLLLIEHYPVSAASLRHTPYQVPNVSTDCLIYKKTKRFRLIGNKGYRKYLKTQGERFAIDEQKIIEEARYDGKWVLRTNIVLPTAEVALKYKQLWMVEEIFRSAKSLLETRPIFHKCDDTIRGHVFCSFLALVLRKALQERLADPLDPLE